MRAIILGFSLALASCGGAEVSAEEQARIDAAKIAAVEKAAILPPVPISPETITFTDIERNELFGAGCSFNMVGVDDAIALTQPDRGILKLDGKIVRLAADRGSPIGPLGSQSKYDGKKYSMKLKIENSAGKKFGVETVKFPARIEVRNGRDQMVFSADGEAQCGS